MPFCIVAYALVLFSWTTFVETAVYELDCLAYLCDNFSFVKNMRSNACPLRFCAKRELAYKKNKWTLSAVSFSPYSLLSMVEGGWLKMPPKRKFRELKTDDEEKTLLEKTVPKSTRYVTKWSAFNIFAQWQNARLNKQAANEEAGFDVERDKIHSLF